ncbi:hypothetical protein LTR95_005852 [Oleoguttula sp. CCFEE 5521]
MHAFNTPASRWQAVVARDPAADGHFVYCVRTTGIYCRPICKARCARRANVEFHTNASDAEAAGFRACKRCQPQLLSYTPETDKIAKALEAIDGLAPEQSLPSLEHLAHCAGLTKHHFHRSFKRTMGVTPREYLLLKRNVGAINEALQTSTTDSSSVSTPWPLLDANGDVWSLDAADSFPAQMDVDWFHALNLATEPDTPPPRFFGSELAVQQPPKVFYTIRQTALGLLSVAFLDGHVCKLELCDSISDAAIELERTFIAPAYALICLDASQSGIEELALLSIRADELVQAIERPSGKTVYIPNAVSGASHAPEVGS